MLRQMHPLRMSFRSESDCPGCRALTSLNLSTSPAIASIVRPARIDLSTLRAELEKERERNRRLVDRIGLIEASVGRLGIDPKESHRAVLKPVRSMNGQDQTETVRVSLSALVPSMSKTDTLC